MPIVAYADATAFSAACRCWSTLDPAGAASGSTFRNPSSTSGRSRATGFASGWVLAHELRWTKVGELGVGVQRMNYGKKVVGPTRDAALFDPGYDCSTPRWPAR